MAGFRRLRLTGRQAEMYKAHLPSQRSRLREETRIKRGTQDSTCLEEVIIGHQRGFWIRKPRISLGSAIN